jgi:Rubrerythrin
MLPQRPLLLRESTIHLASGTEKSLTRAIAGICSHRISSWRFARAFLMQRSSEVSRWVITGGNTVAKNFKDFSEQEILALAISSEETDARIYADFAEGLKADYPATAQIFKEMEVEEG